MGLLIAGLALYVVILPLVLILALARGGQSERQAAIAFLIAVVATQIATAVGSHWRGPQTLLMVVDAALFCALTAIAHQSRSFWPIWAAASQLVGTITHLAPTLHPSIVARAYIASQSVWAFPILAAILIGTVGHMRGQRRAVSDAPERRIP